MIRILGILLAASLPALAACASDPDSRVAQRRNLDREFPSLIRPPAPVPPGSFFVFAYFKDPDPDLYLAVGTDAYTWTPIGGPVLRSPMGLRDPSIVRGPDGAFHLVATGGQAPSQIIYSESSDLIHWAPPRALTVMPEATACWAPELVYDGSQWEIAFSAAIPGRFDRTADMAKANHRLFFTTTHDFVTLAPAQLLLDPGYPCIDAAFLHAGEQWYLFFKDERERPKRKVLRMCKGPSPRGPFGPPSVGLTVRDVEAPCPLNVGNDTLVYFDEFTRGRYGAIRSSDLESWADVSAQMSFPQGARHGTFFTVPEDLGQRLLDQSRNPTGSPASPAPAPRPRTGP